MALNQVEFSIAHASSCKALTGRNLVKLFPLLQPDMLHRSVDVQSYVLRRAMIESWMTRDSLIDLVGTGSDVLADAMHDVRRLYGRLPRLHLQHKQEQREDW